MTYTIPAHAFTASALTLAAALSGCSMQSYGHGGSYASANCSAAATTACLPGYGHSAQGGQYGHYHGGLRGMKSPGKTRYGTSYLSADYAQQSYMQQPQMMQYMPMAYSQPSYQAVSTPTVSQTTSYASPANCPAGTTAQSDGTCLQGSSMSYTSSSPSYSTGYVTSSTTQSCPAGSTASSDGTCLMGGTTSYSNSSYTGSTYSGPTYGSSTSSSVAPALSTHDFSEYKWGSKDTSWGSDSYVSPGTRSVDAPYTSPSYSPSPSYLPNRK